MNARTCVTTIQLKQNRVNQFPEFQQYPHNDLYTLDNFKHFYVDYIFQILYYLLVLYFLHSHLKVSTEQMRLCIYERGFSMYCPKCGNNVASSKFCSLCGTTIEQEAAPTEQPQPAATPPEYQQQPSPAAPPEYQQQPPPGYQQQPPIAPPPGYPQQPYPYAYAPPAPKGFLSDVYSKAFGFLFKKPLLLWGLSLLFTLLTLLAVTFGVVPIIWLPIILVLELGMANIFLRGYRGQEICSAQLFEGFNKKFFRNAGGMGWKSLWVLIWALIPVAGIFIAIVKFYSYRFVPYIMLANPDITATEALKKSMAQTKGHRGKMFVADLLIVLAVIVSAVIFYFAARIPVVGIALFIIYNLIIIAFVPLIEGTLGAVFYDKITKENPVD